MGNKIKAIPVSIRYANSFVKKHHRHNDPVVFAKFAIGAVKDEKIVGVVIVGKPVARLLDDGYTGEVLRLCTILDAPKNVCSFLYARAWRAWRAMGGTRMVTYTLQSESGTSLKAAGWQLVASINGKEWHGTRLRKSKKIYNDKKYRWEIGERSNDPYLPRQEVTTNLNEMEFGFKEKWRANCPS